MTRSLQTPTGATGERELKALVSELVPREHGLVLPVWE